MSVSPSSPPHPTSPESAPAPRGQSAPRGPITSESAIHEREGAQKQTLSSLALSALGIVFGDIGTSPLYSLKECFSGVHAVEGGPSPANVLGVLSLVFWSLTFVVTVKYLSFIMKVSNNGEGGIFALLALIPGKLDRHSLRYKRYIVFCALFGAALLYGDGIITPAISVLSAVEGLEVATSAARPLVVPLTAAIIFFLFLVQKRGTAGIGKVFGPLMAVWFVTIAVLGLVQLVRAPEVLWALNPYHAYRFFDLHRFHGVVVLGAVVLTITGGEALYADMGHFGIRPIRLGWFAVVFPALTLNYLGQGALLLHHPEAAQNPFYAMVPPFMLYPMVALATGATVIASQALISGAFSLTRQAVQLGYCPRVTIVHTSVSNEGQIYIPEVNRALMVACLLLVFSFQSSSALAGAYGIAVTITMAITSVVYYFVATRTFSVPAWKVLPLMLVFLAVDIPYVAGNLLKLFEGGWLPLLVASVIFLLMTTWKAGRAELARRFHQNAVPLNTLLDRLAEDQVHRVSGTAVFMSSSLEGTPPVLLHHLKHNQVLHQQVVVLSILALEQPVVRSAEQLVVQPLGNGFFRVLARYGFMQTPNVPEVLLRCRQLGLKVEPNRTSYYLGHETLLPGKGGKMMRWRKALFALVAKNARPATAYFNIPPGRVVELGMQVDF